MGKSFGARVDRTFHFSFGRGDRVGTADWTWIASLIFANVSRKSSKLFLISNCGSEVPGSNMINNIFFSNQFLLLGLIFVFLILCWSKSLSPSDNSWKFVQFSNSFDFPSSSSLIWSLSLSSWRFSSSFPKASSSRFKSSTSAIKRPGLSTSSSRKYIQYGINQDFSSWTIYFSLTHYYRWFRHNFG